LCECRRDNDSQHRDDGGKSTHDDSSGDSQGTIGV
jgi:hypothetical protein